MSRASHLRALVRFAALFVVLSARSAVADPAPPISGRTEYSPWRRRLLLIPRLIFAIPRELLSLIAAPIIPVVAWNEREHVAENVQKAATWHDGQGGVLPAFDFLRNFHPLIGFSFFDNDALGKDTKLFGKIEAATQNDIVVDLAARPTPPKSPVEFSVDSQFNRRDDQLFSGIRSISPSDNPLYGSRYMIDSIGAITKLSWKYGPLKLGGGDEAAFKRFGNGVNYEHEPAIAEVYCQKELGHCLAGKVDASLVPGYYTGTQYFRTRGFAEIDTRKVPAFSSGFYSGFTTALTQGLGSDHSRYIRFSGEVAGTINLYRNANLLVLRVLVDDLVPLHGITPFSELPTIGGPDDLRGYRLGRFRDYSSLVGTAEYRWRVWIYADMAVFVDVGTTAGRGFSDLSRHEIHPDIGFAIRIHTTDKFIMRIQVAYGFSDGTQFAFQGGDRP